MNIIPYYGNDKIRKVQELILDVFNSVKWNGAKSLCVLSTIFLRQVLCLFKWGASEESIWLWNPIFFSETIDGVLWICYNRCIE